MHLNVAERYALAVVGMAGAGYLIFRGLSRKGAHPNKDEDDEDEDDGEYDVPLRGAK